jgi:hypothetical protein
LEKIPETVAEPRSRAMPCRRLLQERVEPVGFPEQQLVLALNLGDQTGDLGGLVEEQQAGEEMLFFVGKMHDDPVLQETAE